MALDPFELDVRPVLAAGEEPFAMIMQAVERLDAGQGLRLIAPFQPVPLFQVMAQRGFSHAASPIGGGDWEVLFTPADGVAVAVSPNAASPETWPEPSTHIDCSDLEPPEPMTRVLSGLEAMAPGDVLFALLPREPVLLFPQLEARGHQWAGGVDAESGAYRLLVRAAGRPE